MLSFPCLTTAAALFAGAEYMFALLAALLWAGSALVVSRGLARLPRGKRLAATMLGLLIALAAGTAALGLLVLLPAGGASDLRVGPHLALAGLFTFPLGTGLYYLCGAAFGGSVEMAAQFAKVKPVFSLLFAALVIGEAITAPAAVAGALVVVGVLLLALGGVRGHFPRAALGLGLLTALAWAVGELFLRLSPPGGSALADTFVALAAGTVTAGPVLLWAGRGAVRELAAAWVLPFVAHGVLSFGLAYACFFRSIRELGLARTVVITAFWPALSIVATSLYAHFRHRRVNVSPVTWMAILFLLAGSLVQVYDLFRDG